MLKSSSLTRREVLQLGKQEMQYGALKEQVLSQAPTSDYKNAKSEDEKLDMAVQYRKYMNGGFLDFHEVTLGVATSHDRRRKETMLDPYAMLSLIAGVEGAMLPVPDSIYPHTLRRVHPWNLINTDVSSLELQKKEKGTSKVYAPEGAKNKF